MKIEDYSRYYIQGSDHYLVPKDVFLELFNEMESWRQECKELKEQQEEFRKWLENLVANELNLLVIHEHKPYFEEYQDFLEKYEEITGGKNE